MEPLLLKIFEFSVLVNILDGCQTYFVMKYFMLCVNWNILTNCRLSLVQMKINGQNVNNDMTYYSETDSSYHKLIPRVYGFWAVVAQSLKGDINGKGGWNYCLEAGYLNIIAFGWKALFYEDWIVHQYNTNWKHVQSIPCTLVKSISCTGWVIRVHMYL